MVSAFRRLYVIVFSMVASSLTILTLAFERYVMVEAPFRSKDFLIYSHLKLSIVYIWLLSACAAGLSLLNICNEREYRFIITNAIGFPTVIFMFLIYSRIFYVVRKFIRQDLNNRSVSPRDGLLASDNSLTESIRRREREIAMSVFLFVGAFCPLLGTLFYYGECNIPGKGDAGETGPDCGLGALFRDG